MKNQHRLVLLLFCLLHEALVAADTGGKKAARASTGSASLPADAILSFLVRWAEERDSNEPGICLIWGPLSTVRAHACLKIGSAVRHAFF